MVEHFKINHNVISYKSLVNKSTLIFTDESRKDWFQTISYGFSDDFHDDIAKSYEAIISRLGRFSLLGHESDKSIIEPMRVVKVVKDFKGVLGDLIAHNLLVLLIKYGWKPIGARGNIPFELIHNKVISSLVKGVSKLSIIFMYS